jgi:hypothetical protein
MSQRPHALIDTRPGLGGRVEEVEITIKTHLYM